MKRLVVFALIPLLLCAAAHALAGEGAGPGGVPGIPYGTYAFKKQIYMNPLSSFLALEGFCEYYTLAEDAFVITDHYGSRNSMKASYQPAVFDEAAFRESFMMEGFGLPDIAAYHEKSQCTVTGSTGNTEYRLYLLDNEIWLARFHKDSANTAKKEYIWSIYQIERFEGEIPLTFSVSGTQNGVTEFLALLGETASGYDTDTCYNITPDSFLADPVYSVFKFDTSCASFLLYENKIYPMGEWFGGFGVTGMALADLNGDRLQELYFTYSFGSGLHRSHAACFDPVVKQVIPIGSAHLDRDMIVAANEKGGLSLYDAGFPAMDSFVRYEMKTTGRLADIVYDGGRICLNPAQQK